ncbi:DUF6221 family protein [Nonomuraea sp. NPDC050227]|uniref:DUF6221 family protein n=1 Tax=Nonomuraea sp. NPDC050227 TaxID=3364360 RepID=UPI0037895674
MSDLLSWLKATIEGDKAAAEKAQPGPWHIGKAVDPTRPCNVHTFPGARGVADELLWLDAEHVVRHDPRDTIARCTAELALLDEHAEAKAHYDKHLSAPAGELYGLYSAIKWLASGYRHREGFNPEWLRE